MVNKTENISTRKEGLNTRLTFKKTQQPDFNTVLISIASPHPVRASNMVLYPGVPKHNIYISAHDWMDEAE